MWCVSVSAIGCAHGAKGVGAVSRVGALGSWILTKPAPAARKDSSCLVPLPHPQPHYQGHAGDQGVEDIHIQGHAGGDHIRCCVSPGAAGCAAGPRKGRGCSKQKD